MPLYLVQHGKAQSKEEDPNRPLTKEGADEVSKVAKELAEKGIEISRVIHSGKQRAAETAQIFIDVLNSSLQAEVHSNLNPNDDVEEFSDQINLTENVLVVGHLPFLSRLISHLILGYSTKQIVNVKNAGVVALKKSEGNWGVEWINVP